MSVSVDLLKRAQAHIAQVQADPTVPLDERLFKESETFLTVQLYNDPPELLKLVISLSNLLSTLQQDPTPVIALLSRLVEPFSFSDVLQLQPPVDFLAGLDISAVPFNSLVLQLLEKASRSSKDVATLANMPPVIHSLVKLLLCTPDMGTADKAGKVLIELLKTDKEQSDVPNHGVGDDSASDSGGQGLLWRRLFGDKDIYGLFFSICSLQHAGPAPLGKREKTVAQARLLSILPQIGVLDWHYLSRSHHPDIEASYGVAADGGLLDYVCLRMTDTKNDILIHMNVIQFFADLISTVRTPLPSDRNISLSLDYLISRNLHARALSFWLNPDDPSHDPIDLNFLYGPSAHYLSIYASTYPSAFLASPDTLRVLTRLSQAFSTSSNQWAHGQSPKHDLTVLTSLPRIALLPQRHLGTGRQSSPLLLVPSKITNADALNSLAIILHGPPRATEELTYTAAGFQQSQNPSSTEGADANAMEAAAAYALYTTYIHYHDTFYADLIQHADIIALPEKALAAINLLSALASANYAPLPSEPTDSPIATSTTSSTPQPQQHQPPQSPPTLPTPASLATTLSTPTLPPYHPTPLLTTPASLDKLLPWLLRPPQTFTNLVGGRGDPESAAYKVAMAKWDLVLLVRRRVGELVDVGGEEGEGVRWIGEALEVRIGEGVWGRRADVGGEDCYVGFVIVWAWGG